MTISRRGFLKISSAALGALLTGACQTANYALRDTHGVTKNSFKNMQKAASTLVQTPGQLGTSTLSYEEAQRIMRTYEHLPPQKVGIYFPTGNDEVLEARLINTHFNVNPSLDEIAELEKGLPEHSRKARFISGAGANPDDVVARSADNRASRRSGLFSADYYATTDKTKFFIQIEETTALNRRFRHENFYRVKIYFGEEAFRQLKKRTDFILPLVTLEHAGLGYLAAGKAGAAGAAGAQIIESIWAYFEGLSMPWGTSLTDHRVYNSKLTERESDVYSALLNSPDVRARNLIVVPHQAGTGIVYAGDIYREDDEKRTGVYIVDNMAEFTTTEEGIRHLKYFLYSILQVGTRAQCRRFDTRTVREVRYIRIPCDGSGGRGSGGPGGSLGGGSGHGSPGGSMP